MEIKKFGGNLQVILIASDAGATHADINVNLMYLRMWLEAKYLVQTLNKRTRDKGTSTAMSTVSKQYSHAHLGNGRVWVLWITLWKPKQTHEQRKMENRKNRERKNQVSEKLACKDPHSSFCLLYGIYAHTHAAHTRTSAHTPVSCGTLCLSKVVVKHEQRAQIIFYLNGIYSHRIIPHRLLLHTMCGRFFCNQNGVFREIRVNE